MKARYLVAVYHVDLAYGGAEEGGWYFNCGSLVRIVRVFANQERAYAFCRRLNDRLHATLNKDRRPITSVLSEGEYAAEVHENQAPDVYPDRRPHYE
jgi:hypothetical protein